MDYKNEQEKTLHLQLAMLKTYRQRAQIASAELAMAQAALESLPEYQKVILCKQAMMEAEEDVDIAQEQARQAAIAAHKADPLSSKQQGWGLAVVQGKQLLKYTAESVISWAEKYLPAAVEKKLRIKAFEKEARIMLASQAATDAKKELDALVFIEQELTAAIASSLDILPAFVPDLPTQLERIAPTDDSDLPF